MIFEMEEKEFTVKQLEFKIEKLIEIYQSSQRRVDELEYNYLNSSHLKNKTTPEILIELWNQSKSNSEMRRIFEKILSNYQGVELVKINEKEYTFVLK